MSDKWFRGLVIAIVSLLWSANPIAAQDDPFGDELDDAASGEDDGSKEDGAQDDAASQPAEEPAEEPVTESTQEESVSAEGSASLADGLSLSASEDVDDTDTEAATIETTGPARPPRLAGSHIRRPRLMIEGATIVDGPLRVTFEDREQLRMRSRETAGYALPDTAAALGIGASGTAVLELRSQPALILLNGRRLVSAPYSWRAGADIVDINQIPMPLVSHAETSVGILAGLYGDGAIGGVINYVTHRDYDGIEVELGGAVTDKFDQHEADVSLTVGAGSEKSGMNVMVSYFNRQPLAAADRDWIGERLERTESIVGNPASYQPLVNFVEYPFVDPGCAAATQVGDATGEELRIPLFGEPRTRAGGNALDQLPTDTITPIDHRMRLLENFDSARGDGDGVLEAGETATYCGADLSPFHDLILKDERIQTYATFWHDFSDHTEGFGELGFYRTENENRTAPSFPVARISPDEAAVDAVVVPADHADIPLQYRGFAVADDVPMDARVANNFFIVGSPLAAHAGANVHKRQVDVFRGVLGLRGDLADLAQGSTMESWDWEISGLYSTSDGYSSVKDILLDKLGEALASCPGTVLDNDVASPTYLMEVPSTIKQRQELGCFNPFYSSVANNIAVDPLNQSTGTIANERGFITTDTETSVEQDGFGLQDGGYICDPADPSLPCPAAFDPDGDGVFELAGTPNTQQVIDRMTGEHITQESRTLATADFLLSGDLASFSGGGLAFGLGGQFRRETLGIDHDAAYNQRRYAFLFGGPDVPTIGRNVGAGFAELRLRAVDGLLEVQAAARAEHVEDVGTAVSPLGGLALRPFASSKGSALEWLIVRGHAGLGHRAPSLVQQHGTYTEFHSVEFEAARHFIPHEIQGTTDLDFEKYMTVSGGLQWDYAGFKLSSDFWTTFVDDVIGGDNVQTLLADCEEIDKTQSVQCPEVAVLSGAGSLNHVVSKFDNLAEVETNGVDGGASYTLDTKRRGMGEMGTFVLGVRGRFINSYLIKSPRALREFYRAGGGTPTLNADQSRNYANVTAEYEAAGFRNLENFAPPMPKLRVSVPLRWFYGGHTLGATARYIGSYNDDSEATIEKYGLADQLAAFRAPGTVAVADGEEIAAWTVFDLGYGYTFGDDGWETGIALGVINVLDEDPPEAEGSLGYDVGIHDPRGRTIYARVTGKF